MAAPLDRHEELSSKAGDVMKHLGQWMEGKIERDQLTVDLAKGFHILIVRLLLRLKLPRWSNSKNISMVRCCVQNSKSLKSGLMIAR